MKINLYVFYLFKQFIKFWHISNLLELAQKILKRGFLFFLYLFVCVFYLFFCVCILAGQVKIWTLPTLITDKCVIN